ncbi:HdeD family acid-resistance protein [Altererythrobacter fulvus]|uniref:HdeD family acid-resistance protein n=1 Tax=Caenibius fulvus TaxID=2126012 RepID=UPI00301A42C0
MDSSGNPVNSAEFQASIFVLPRHNWRWFLVRGLLAIALGILALLVPGLTVFAFAMLFGAFSFADGLLSLGAGIRGARSHADRWGMLVFSGLLGIAVGVLFFVWPMLAAATYALFLVIMLAMWALFTGLFELFAAIRLRREIEGEWLLGLSGALSVLLGVAILAMLAVAPGASLISLGWLIGLYALASGIALVMLALRLRKEAA